MKLSREELIELRKNGELGGKGYFPLLKQALEVIQEDEDPEEIDRQAVALEKLVKVVEQIGNRKQEVLETERLEPALKDIVKQLQELTAATKAATKTREKTWEFVPEYGYNGRITKLTAR
jgi:DNA-binding transcriptional regulator GbsR (MarR family)